MINEFPSVAPLAERLVGAQREFVSKAALLNRLGFHDHKSDEAKDALSVLTLSGLLGARPREGRYYIPRLYRPVLLTVRSERAETGDPKTEKVWDENN
ncbi:hypothetical protein G3I15_45350 [Streptomyces sp. SID10244]|nr:hypothetical protein [Streptomyces sp. SID10244]